MPQAVLVAWLQGSQRGRQKQNRDPKDTRPAVFSAGPTPMPNGIFRFLVFWAFLAE